MKKMYSWILKLLGWRVKVDIQLPNKCVLCVAPHTSNWDLPLGLTAYRSIGQKVSFLIKKDWFFFPMNLIFNFLGGIPVNRTKKMSLTDQIAEIFNSKEYFHLAITPEGTRKATSEWKMGFYYIALAAKVPIVIISFDYKYKEIKLHETYYPTGEMEKDMDHIKSFYKDINARFPKQFSL